MRRAREVALDAYAHQDLPFEKLVAELAPDRDLSRPPLFRVLLVLQNAPLPDPVLPGIAAERLPVASRTAKFDLTLSLVPAGAGLAGWLEYSTELFDAVTVQRLLAHLERLLAGLVDPEARETRLTSLPLLAPAERLQMLVEWNDTGTGLVRDVPDDRCLHELFAAQAATTPEAVAVVCGTERLTYGELNRRANRLANRLRALGVGPETPVGVCLERGPELVPALLGILKAGGAYVPLDPAYPEERLAFILEDSGVPVLVTQRALASRLPGSAARVVVEDRAGDSDGDAGLIVPAGDAGEDNLAYLIYTSGSTGLPKGVAITHRNATALVRWSAGQFAAADLAGVLAATSICFDLSVFELFVPLSRGGTVLLAEDALALAGLPAASEVTLINTVPSAMTELVRLGPPPPGLRTINLAGEPLQSVLVREIERWCPGVRVFNLYGPSEDTTYSTGARVDGNGHPPAIGRPVSGTRAYLLDRHLGLVPPGSHGETLSRRRRLGAGLLQPAGADGGTVHPRPLRAGSGRTPLRHRRPRPLPARRRSRVPGPARPSGEDPRLPHRAG